MDLISYLLAKNSVKPSPAPTPEPTLPSAYTKVNYIESSGTQYIDTGYIPNANTKIEIKCLLIVGGGGLAFGNRMPAEGGGDDIYYSLASASGKATFFYNQRVRVISDVNLGEFVDFSVESNKVNFNGVEYDNITIDQFPTYPIILFGLNNADTMALSSTKIGRTKIYENNVLIHDYIPCYRNSDSEVGMYDVIAEEFLTNDGTGDFSYENIYE